MLITLLKRKVFPERMDKGTVEIEKNPKYQKDMDKALAVIHYNLRRLREENSGFSARRNSDGQDDTLKKHRETPDQEMLADRPHSRKQRIRRRNVAKAVRRVSFHKDVDVV